jgi:iron complex outermembrane receptor protein
MADKDRRRPFVLLATIWPLAASAIPNAASDLKQLSLEELMDVEVTSVSRSSETLERAAAAVSVVTNEDIRRSGATSVPEALRLVPGLHVARSDASTWAVSSRGFSSTNSEKLLVLSDTRSLYTPLYSGVFWDVQDYLMEDIERIEVIRGPGAALWGSNAVNGVINITTRRARDTQGLYLEAGGGTEERTISSVRYGGRIAEDGYFRVFGRYVDRDDTYNVTSASSDDWHLAHGGFRGEWQMGSADELTVQGDVYSGTVGLLSPSVSVSGRPGPQGPLRSKVDGGNVLGRWQRAFEEDSNLQLRFYYDHTMRDDPSFVDRLDTLDLDLQHQFAIGTHQIVWGANYRHTDNRNDGRGVFALQPPDSKDDVYSAFVQDQVPLTSSLRLTLGTKLEHNDFSGFEFQPSVRFNWEVTEANTVWAAVSRAVRVPTRVERDIAIDASNPAGNPVVRLVGNGDFRAETLVAYELGYRWWAASNVALDVAAFYNDYDELASLEVGTPFVDSSSGRIIVPIVSRNLTSGDSQGVELLLQYSPLPRWRLTGSYSYFQLHLDPQGADLNRGELLEGATPKHQFGVRSLLDLPGNLQFDVQWRRLSDIRSSPEIGSGLGIGGYSELDVRLAWRGWRQAEIVLVGQNLLHDRHAEFGAPGSRGEIERSVYGKITWGF